MVATDHSGSYSGAAAATDWYGWWCATMLPMMRAVRVAPLQAAAWQVRIPLGACELTTPRLLFTDQDAGVEGFEVGGLLRTGASTGSCAGGGEHTGTAPPRALGLHACLDHRSLPHFTNPCHLSAHRCWPRVEDIHLSPQLAPRVLQRFITGAVHPRQLQCGYGPQGPEVGLSVLTETSQGLTSRLADLGARRPHPRHYVAAGGDQRSSQHSDQRSGQRSDQRNNQRRPAGRRSTASPAQQLKKHIVACFDNLRGGPRAAELDVIVRENRGAMTPASAITLMHRCAKTLKDRNGRNHVDVRPYLSMIVDVVGQPTVKLPMVHLSMALYGLQSMSSNEPEVKALLQALAPKVTGCKEELSAQAVGNALYGLQSMSSNEPEVKALLQVLAPKVKGCKEQLDAQAVSNALYGLQSMSSNEPE
ncbi:hypothetical protein CYMTET_19982, partial [Cymbomonas tetramitiformis]